MAIGIVATVKVKDGSQAGFEEAALRLVQAVNEGEPGCLLYTLNRGEEPLAYVFMERYADEEAVATHRASEHYRSIGAELGAFMDGRPEVMVLTELG